MKINWFSLIYVIVNCSVWSVVAVTCSRFSQAWPHSAACSVNCEQQLVSGHAWLEWDYGWI